MISARLTHIPQQESWRVLELEQELSSERLKNE